MINMLLTVVFQITPMYLNNNPTQNGFHQGKSSLGWQNSPNAPLHQFSPQGYFAQPQYFQSPQPYYNYTNVSQSFGVFPYTQTNPYTYYFNASNYQRPLQKPFQLQANKDIEGRKIACSQSYHQNLNTKQNHGTKPSLESNLSIPKNINSDGVSNASTRMLTTPDDKNIPAPGLDNFSNKPNSLNSSSSHTNECPPHEKKVNPYKSMGRIFDQFVLKKNFPQTNLKPVENTNQKISNTSLTPKKTTGDHPDKISENNQENTSQTMKKRDRKGEEKNHYKLNLTKVSDIQNKLILKTEKDFRRAGYTNCIMGEDYKLQIMSSPFSENPKIYLQSKNTTWINKNNQVIQNKYNNSYANKEMHVWCEVTLNFDALNIEQCLLLQKRKPFALPRNFLETKLTGLFPQREKFTAQEKEKSETIENNCDYFLFSYSGRRVQSLNVEDKVYLKSFDDFDRNGHCSTFSGEDFTFDKKLAFERISLCGDLYSILKVKQQIKKANDDFFAVFVFIDLVIYGTKEGRGISVDQENVWLRKESLRGQDLRVFVKVYKKDDFVDFESEIRTINEVFGNYGLNEAQTWFLKYKEQRIKDSGNSRKKHPKNT